MSSSMADMKITLAKGSIEKAPKTHTRIAFVQEKGVNRLVRENGVETIELGVATPLTKRKFITLCRSIIATAKQFKKRKIAVEFASSPWLWKGMEDIAPEELARIAAENYEMANFEFTAYKTKPKEGWNQVDEILVYGPWTKSIEDAAKHGQVVGQEVNKTRELSNTPGGHMTPRGLAAAAKAAVKGLPVEVTTIGRAQIQKLGMGLLAGVGAGTPNEPTFTVMTYAGGKKGERPIVLIGKGITSTRAD
jgi:leucyl aminopeptidase